MSRTDIVHQVRLKLRFIETGQKRHMARINQARTLYFIGHRMLRFPLRHGHYATRKLSPSGRSSCSPPQDYVEGYRSYAGKEIRNPRQGHRRPTTLKPSAAAMLDRS